MACCKVCDFDICQTCIEVSLYGGGHCIHDTQAPLISCPTCDISECSGMEASWFYSSFQCTECHACGVCCAKYGSKCTVEFEVEPLPLVIGLTMSQPQYVQSAKVKSKFVVHAKTVNSVQSAV